MNPSERTQPRICGVSRAVQQVAKQMRREMTPAERVLWLALRGETMRGLRWRAQHPIGQFVLDFYCPACKLAVELDGTGHDVDQDAARTAFLEAYGCRVLRFANTQVLTDMEGIMAQIAHAIDFPPLLPAVEALRTGAKLGGPGGPRP